MAGPEPGRISGTSLILLSVIVGNQKQVGFEVTLECRDFVLRMNVGRLTYKNTKHVQGILEKLITA